MSGENSFGRNKALLAVAVGAGAVVGAAGIFLYHALNEKKKLNVLKQLVRQSKCLDNGSQSTSTVSRSKRNSVSSSRTGYETEDEMFSALNSDCEDKEFYDLNSEAEETLEENNDRELKLFEEVDFLLKGDDDDRLRAFNLLKKHKFEMSENPDFLWRYAKAHCIQATLSEDIEDTETKKKYVYEGLEYAEKALAIDNGNPDVHKWFATLIGMQVDFVSFKEKIEKGILFQKHILLAIEHKPDDYFLHHLLGRFKFEVANLSWLEKKLVSTVFADISDFSYSDVITDLLTAEELNPSPWKPNRLLLARCYLEDGKYDKGFEWLESAEKIKACNKEDRACDLEINILRKKFEKYKK